MQSRFGQSPENLPTQATSQARPQNGSGMAYKEIPYDYVATFTLEGRRGNRVQDVINISVEGAFMVVSIGYSFILKQETPEIDAILKSAAAAGMAAASSTTISGRLLSIVQPFLSPLRAIRGGPLPYITAEEIAQCVAIRLCGIDFKYSIIDSATGRELQNKPIHNIAGLGEASGIRPFRPLAKPMLFQPRSTIRIEIDEVSQGLRFAGAELFFVLHGYKMLGYGTGLP
jgi:hypothetical protein